jgi:opacity protein-like surface antigen
MRTSDVLRLSACTLVLVAGLAAPAHADGFINPFLGYHFGGDSACPTVSECENKKITLGVAAGVMGSFVGFEVDFSYAPDFFGTAPALETGVGTLMANLMIVPRIGPVRPYVIGGVGLIRTTASTTVADLLVADNNHLGIDLGGGLMIFFGSHVGIRGDIRGYRSLQDLKVFGFVVPNTKLIFGRASAGLVLAF